MKMKRTLAALFVLTMAAGLAACGETGGTTDSGTEAESTVAESSTAAESAEESQTDSAESEGSTADEYSAESSETAQSGAYQMVSFSSEHEPFGIKFDYALPKLENYDPTPDDARNPDYFNYGVTYHYNYRTDDESLYGIRADVYAGIYNAENAAGYYKAKEGQQTDKTENGYACNTILMKKRTVKKTRTASISTGIFRFTAKPTVTPCFAARSCSRHMNLISPKMNWKSSCSQQQIRSSSQTGTRMPC